MKKSSPTSSPRSRLLPLHVPGFELAGEIFTFRAYPVPVPEVVHHLTTWWSRVKLGVRFLVSSHRVTQWGRAYRKNRSHRTPNPPLPGILKKKPYTPGRAKGLPIPPAPSCSVPAVWRADVLSRSLSSRTPDRSNAL